MTSARSTVIARINGEDLTASDLIRFLRVTLRSELLEEAIADVLIDQACREANITVSLDEIAQDMDAFRQERRLFTEKATRDWLAQRGLSDEDFEYLFEREIKRRKLKDALFSSKVAERFAYDKHRMDRVELYRIVVDDESAARELVALIKDGANIHGLAKQHSQDDATRLQCGYMGIVERQDLRPEVESAVFGSCEGAIVGPIKSLGSYQIFQVERFYPASLDEATRQSLKDKLFQEWLQARLKGSDIELLI
jgi:putative peptide maturation system protein